MCWLGIITLSGCGVSLAPAGADGSRSTLNLSSLNFDGEAPHLESAPNDLFSQAEPVDISSEARLIRGSVSGEGDVDVYDLGPVDPDEHIVVTMTAAVTLKGAVALFDEQGTSLLINDHRNVYLGKTAPFIDVVTHRRSESCYVAVAATPGFASSGDYTLEASKGPAAQPPTPQPDNILLVFDGASHVRIGSRSPVNVEPFDAGHISPVFSGRTELMMQEIVKRVRQDYAPYDVTIFSTSEGDTFEPGMSRIYFGTDDPALLGVAEGIDEFNATPAQQAIVFTDTFAAFMPLSPSLSGMSQAIANVASHEMGHLLGMVHTADPGGIMDVTASLSQLLRDQQFTKSPLFSAVFPLGYQDAQQYLLDAVGGDPSVLAPKRLHDLRRKIDLQLGGPEESARERFHLSTCTTIEP